MTGWTGPAWGEPSNASDAEVPLRAGASSSDANYRADGGSSAGFVVLAASVAGVAHRLAGRRPEDAYAWLQPTAGHLALVVADGVSTAGRGGEGADLAVGAAQRHLLAAAAGGQGWGERECVAAIGAASDELRRAGGGLASQLSTTLVVALVSLGDGSATRAVIGRVGDSTAFTLSADGAWGEIFGCHGTSEVSTTATEVLPLPVGVGAPAQVETALVELQPDMALVLATDGVADPLRDGPTTVAPSLASVLAAGPTGELSPLALAYAADFSRRGALDDRTLLVAWCRPAGEVRADVLL